MSSDESIQSKRLPTPIKRMQANETVEGVVTDFDLIPSKFHPERLALKVRVKPKSGLGHEFIVQHSDTDAYRTLYSALTETGIGVRIKVGASEGFLGRSIVVIKTKPKT